MILQPGVVGKRLQGRGGGGRKSLDLGRRHHGNCCRRRWQRRGKGEKREFLPHRPSDTKLRKLGGGNSGEVPDDQQRKKKEEIKNKIPEILFTATYFPCPGLGRTQVPVPPPAFSPPHWKDDEAERAGGAPNPRTRRSSAFIRRALSLSHWNAWWKRGNVVAPRPGENIEGKGCKAPKPSEGPLPGEGSCGGRALRRDWVSPWE